MHESWHRNPFLALSFSVNNPHLVCVGWPMWISVLRKVLGVNGSGCPLWPDEAMAPVWRSTGRSTGGYLQKGLAFEKLHSVSVVA